MARISYETAVRRIRTSGRCTEAQARAAGYYVCEGAYNGTCDDQAGRWYLNRCGQPGNHRGSGYPSKAAALDGIVANVLQGIA